MPITGLRIWNFKRFEDTGEVPLAPLTVLLGRNSSGKSSITQPLLLLKQTIESRGFANTLNLRGPLYAATSYREIVHNHEVNRQVRLRMDISVEASEVPRGAEIGLPWLSLFGVHGKDGPLSASVELTVGQEEPFGPQLRHVKVNLADGRQVNARFAADPKRPDRPEWQVEEPTKKQWQAVPSGGRMGVSLFPVFFDSKPIENKRGRSMLSFQISEEAVLFNASLAYVEGCLRDMRYLGPFRTPPKPRYEFAGRDFPDIGAAGENAMDALIADGLRKTSRRGVVSKVTEWLRYAGLADRFELRPLSDEANAYEAHLTVNSMDANYAHVGYGVSQVLPVLVQALRTNKNALFICQQPELHLHPDAQVALADFFLDRVREERYVLLETHSEPLVLGIRRALLDEQRRSRPRVGPKDVAFLYVEDGVSGGATVRPLPMDEDMNITEWPPGFMDAATQERLKIMDAVLGTSRAGEARGE
jgi:predicted ATPase